MPEFPAPREGFVLTHFIVSNDLDRSRQFYTEVLGGELVLESGPVIVQLANGWVIINTGGGPTDDKPTVTLEPPRDLPSRFDGIDFGVLATAIPEVPPQSGAILPGDDPIRFGSADIVTFTPWGTATGGTVFVSDGRDTVCAVVLYGKTGRLRTFRLDRAQGRWFD